MRHSALSSPVLKVDVVSSSREVGRRIQRLAKALSVEVATHSTLPVQSADLLFIADHQESSHRLLECRARAAQGRPSILVLPAAQCRPVLDAIRAGALEIVPDDASDEELLRSIEQGVAEAQRWRIRQAASELLKGLTAREREVVEHIVAGQTSKQIAAELGASAKTIEAHRMNILRKLRVHSTLEVIKIALAGAEFRAR